LLRRTRIQRQAPNLEQAVEPHQIELFGTYQQFVSRRPRDKAPIAGRMQNLSQTRDQHLEAVAATR
jgi:hypothetical protein